MFLLTLCVVAGVKIVRSGHRSLVETAEICERLEKRGLRFEARQTVIDNTCHIFGGNYAGTSGNGTRMCIYVHPEDCPEAERIFGFREPLARFRDSVI